MPISGSNIVWAFTDMNVSTLMMYLSLPLLASSESAHRQRLCPNNARCCFHNFWELYRCLGRGGGGVRRGLRGGVLRGRNCHLLLLLNDIPIFTGSTYTQICTWCMALNIFPSDIVQTILTVNQVTHRKKM